MKKFIYILLSLITISSCISPLDETCSLPVAGLWVSVDDRGFVSEYIEFKNGYYKSFTTEKPAYYNERTIWAANKSDFEKIIHDEYSIIDGVLYTQNTATPISFNNEILVIGGKKYYTLKDFTAKYYSVITCDNPKHPSFKYSTTEVSWGYEITNRPLGNRVNATVDVDWINAITVTENKVSFKINENNTGKDRKAILTLTYPTASPVAVEIEQTYADSKIILSAPSATCDYNGGELGFSYVVEFPRENLSAELLCDSEWISELSDKEGSVSFNVSENNTGAERTCDIVVSYGSVTEAFKVTQTYSATRIELSPKQINVDYREIQYCYFDCQIENPRQNCSMSVSCNEEWIQDINLKQASDTKCKVEFTVKENNDVEPERFAEIYLNYGELSEKVTIVQTNAQPVINLSAPSIQCSYLEKAYNFTYLIDNPRESITPSVTTEATWIKIMSDNNATVSFVVSENNSGNSRIGEIVVAYGAITKTFVVDQEYLATSLIVNAEKKEFDYRGGVSYIDYVVKNPRKDTKVVVSCNANWITEVVHSDEDTYGKISFVVSENNDNDSFRTARITISYGSTQEYVTITQTNDSPVIKMNNGGMNCGYEEKFYTFEYTIDNSRESLTASVIEKESWITDLKDNNGVVSFKVLENNSGSDRTGEIIVAYGNITATFIVSQSYVAPVLHVAAYKTMFDYNGGTSVINYAIQNARNGEKVRVSSNADWVTDLSVSDYGTYGKIDFNVLVNDSVGEERSAQVNVIYGDVVESVTIYQTNESPIIYMDNGSAKCSYREESYSFTYTIANQRESFTTSVSTEDSWITGVTDEKGTVSFKVSENNDGYRRVGHINISYGYVTTSFVVDQEYLNTHLHVNAKQSEFTYTGGSSFINYTVENPRNGCKIGVSCEESWVTDLKIEEENNYGKIYFNVAENVGNEESRTAYIAVTYGTVVERISITQSNETPVIKMLNGGMRYNYTEGAYNFTYTIENPRGSYTPSVSTNAKWITDLRDNNGTVSFRLTENNDGNQRDAEIRISYGNVTASYMVIQEYLQPLLSIYSEKYEFDYKGGPWVINYGIQNPRQGAKVSVSCKASWVSDLTINEDNDHGTISFNIAENDSNEEYRTATIQLSYGETGQTFTFVQSNEQPVIKMNDGGMNCGYEEKTYSYAYTIENPRKSLTPRASTKESWITDVALKDGALSFKVLENNSGDRRDGQILISYGTASKIFVVQQGYVAPSLFVGPDKTEFGYTGGALSISYAIQNPRNGVKLNVSSDASWVTDMNIEDCGTYGKIYFNIKENDTEGNERTANIRLSYANTSEVLTIVQYNQAPVINMPNGGMTYGYVEGTYTFTYTIDNPRQSFTPRVVSNTNWITGVQDNNGTVTFTIAENNDGYNRQGEIRITYGNVTRDFFVYQNYTRTNLFVKADKESFNYKGGSSFINYTVENPRKGAKIGVSCNANWITGLNIVEENNYGRIYFTVMENIGEGEERTAQIVVTYGDNIGEYVQISQTNESPVIQMQNGGCEYGYTDGSYSFTYTIDNPRTSYAASIATNVNWITDVRDNNGTVTFNLLENNDEVDRNGQIRVTYGNIFRDYFVIQKYLRPTIHIRTEKNEYDYKGGSGLINYSIENPRKGAKVNVFCESPWVTDLKINEENNYGTITFKVAENNENAQSRTANIIVAYGVSNEMVYITQTNNPPVINLHNGGMSCDYIEGQYNFSYTIENPRDSYTSKVSTNVNWIKDLRESNGVVTFKVDENNDGVDRDAEIQVSYGNVTARFIVRQEYQKPSVLLHIDKDEFDYLGGSAVINYVIENPRKNTKVNVSCESPWVTTTINEVNDTHGTITINVLPIGNETGSREARIAVSYGTVGSTVSITQLNNPPSIKLNIGGITCGYAEGTYNFTYTIQNPRESWVANISSTANWITDINDNNGVVSFKVAENNDGYQRDAEIRINYGEATEMVHVVQKYTKPDLHVALIKREFDYKGGPATITYNIQNPRKASKIGVSCTESWVTGLSINESSTTSGNITFNVLENVSDAESRTANIVVTYGSVGESLTITQSNESPIIEMQNGGMSCEYTEGTYNFTYSIKNPRETFTPEVLSRSSWITNVKDNNGTVTFTVAENNDGYDRDGEIMVKYGNVTRMFYVNQKYTSTTIHLYTKQSEFNYKGGQLVINYSIENPRKGLKINASSNSQWLSGPTIVEENNYGTITYNIPEITGNDESRTGYVTVSYGSYGDAISVTQINNPPVIHLPEGGKRYGYEEGTYNFTYQIENPRESITPTVSANESWITGLSINNGVVSFKLAENNDGFQRDAEIRITYGKVTASYVVIQEFTQPIIYRLNGDKEFDYAGGSSTTTFMIQYPRKDLKPRVECYESWVTGIRTEEVLSGNELYLTVSFNVAENNDTQDQRYASIIVNYGNTSESTNIIQSNAKPAIKLPETGRSYSYDQGSYSFAYTIENPRQSITPTVSTGSYWITNLRISNGVVTFSLPENNEGTRLGEIYITYGDQTAMYIVAQEYKEVAIYHLRGDSEYDKNGGSYSVLYMIKNPRKSTEPQISCNASWVTGLRYEKYQTSNADEIVVEIFYTIARNTTSNYRSAQLSIAYGNNWQTLTINQSN